MKAKHSKRPFLASILLTTATGLAVGCDEGTDTCDVETLQQNTSRALIGSVVWLPRPTGTCEGRAWRVLEAPSGALAVAHDDPEWPRLTPDAVGTWRLGLEGASNRFELNVVEPAPEAFVHYNYYPSRALASVGSELWVANTFAPTVTRIVAGAVAEQIPVGGWPVALAHAPEAGLVLVAQRSDDTVAFIDAASRRVIDAVHVGDEPANLVLTPDGRTAFAALAADDAVAVIDVATRALIRVVPTVKDPLAMAMSADGGTLWVASFRSGQPDRAPFGADPVETERDLAAIDIASFDTRYINDIGHTITALLPTADGASLWVAHTRGDPFADFVNPPEGRFPFQHEILVVDAVTGAITATRDLGHGDGSGGPVVGLRDLALFDGALWVSSEGTDETLALDPATLAEQGRVATGGRPRALLVHDGALYVHGPQAWRVTRIDTDNSTTPFATGTETRDAAVAEGQRFFTGAGRTYGIDWSCNTCHVDGGSDTLVWKAGPFESRHSPRPLFWLDATLPLGWDGYSASARNFAHTGPVNIGVKATTAEATALAAYLEALVPPPAATSLTRRDGTLSDAALDGRAVFVSAGCEACHAGPVATNRALLDDGITTGLSDVPSLIGVRRHVAWLKHGDARTLRDAVEAAVDVFAPAPLEDADVERLTRYVAELGALAFEPITTRPMRGELAATDRPITITLSAPIFADATNLARISLRDAAGTDVAATPVANGAQLVITPNAPLAPSARYTVAIAAGFESHDGRRAEAVEIGFETAAAPTLRLDGEYRWVVDVPFPDFANGRFDNSRTVAVTTPLTAAMANAHATLAFDFGDDLIYTATAVIDGATLRAPGVPVPAGTALGDSRGLEGTLTDTDDDGVADTASGTLTLTGPGFVVEDVAWRLIRPPSAPSCTEGPAGDVAVEVTFDAGRPVIAWDAEAGQALAIYVTTPGATLPLFPGQVVEDGTAYWVLAAETFPAGFPGPARYGETAAGSTDTGPTHGAPTGGAALEAGQCLQFSVTTNQFTTGWVVARMPANFTP
jgi:YVTN family beta-propeller protein